MGIEREIKFEVSPRDLPKLVAARDLPRTNGQPPKKEYLLSPYFDPPKSIPHESGVSLRVRQTGKTRVQTIKAEDNGASFGRGEWEQKLQSDEPDLRAARG